MNRKHKPQKTIYRLYDDGYDKEAKNLSHLLEEITEINDVIREIRKDKTINGLSEDITFRLDNFATKNSDFY